MIEIKLSDDAKSGLFYLLHDKYDMSEWTDDEYFMYFCYCLYKSFYGKECSFRDFLMGNVRFEVKGDSIALKEIEKLSYQCMKVVNKFYKKLYKKWKH